VNALKPAVRDIQRAERFVPWKRRWRGDLGGEEIWKAVSGLRQAWRLPQRTAHVTLFNIGRSEVDWETEVTGNKEDVRAGSRHVTRSALGLSSPLFARCDEVAGARPAKLLKLMAIFDARITYFSDSELSDFFIKKWVKMAGSPFVPARFFDTRGFYLTLTEILRLFLHLALLT